MVLRLHGGRRWSRAAAQVVSRRACQARSCSGYAAGVAESNPKVADELERYVRTGDADIMHTAWPGGFMDRGHRAHDDLRGALLRRVHELASGRMHHPIPESDATRLARSKVEPMVRGLFPRAEQDLILAKLEKSVVFLSRANIDSVLLAKGFHRTAWDLANLYLSSVGAELLGDTAPAIVGLSQETTCFVLAEYFAEQHPFADFVVHEAAHIFHNCKRSTLGLRETRTKEWLLPIDFQERETFAYSCEAHACILRRAKNRPERQALADEYARTVRVPDERVDSNAVVDILRAAVESRNGWKVIASRCGQPSARRMSSA